MDVVAVGTAASVATESIDLLKSALGMVPADGGKHRAPRERRMEAYLDFQRAAHEASVWPGWLSVLEDILLRKQVTPDQVLPDMAAARQSTAALLSALSEIRMVGSPELRALAEEIVTLLVELMESRLPSIGKTGLRFQLSKRLYKLADQDKAREFVKERFPGLLDRYDETALQVNDDLRRARAARFNDTQLALGRWNRKFTLVARKDLGYGPRFWHVGKKPRKHRWQIWRPYDQWPGGWPPRDAKELVNQARQERLSAQSERRALGPVRETQNHAEADA